MILKWDNTILEFFKLYSNYYLKQKAKDKT